MPTKNNAYTIYEQGWILRIQPPELPENNQVLILLHGWTGDEHSMDVFARGLAQHFWLISPRAPIATRRGGYGWVDIDTGEPAGYAQYRSVTHILAQRISAWRKNLKLPDQPYHLMGFSQGAAAALVLALEFPERTGHIAAMAGFLPTGAQEAIHPNQLAGKPVYIAHGSQDEIVPVSKAYDAIRLLDKAGAQVTYCEDAVGHKLSATCFNGMKAFFLPDAGKANGPER